MKVTEVNNCTFNIDLEEDEERILRAGADQQGVSLEEYIVMLIKAYLDDVERV